MNRKELASMLASVIECLNEPLCTGYHDADMYLHSTILNLKSAINDALMDIEESYEYENQKYAPDPMDIRKAQKEGEE